MFNSVVQNAIAPVNALVDESEYYLGAVNGSVGSVADKLITREDALQQLDADKVEARRGWDDVLKWSLIGGGLGGGIAGARNLATGQSVLSGVGIGAGLGFLAPFAFLAARRFARQRAKDVTKRELQDTEDVAPLLQSPEVRSAVIDAHATRRHPLIGTEVGGLGGLLAGGLAASALGTNSTADKVGVLAASTGAGALLGYLLGRRRKQDSLTTLRTALRRNAG